MNWLSGLVRFATDSPLRGAPLDETAQIVDEAVEGVFPPPPPCAAAAASRKVAMIDVIDFVINRQRG